MKKNQRGFSPVEIILALLVAALLAFLGWYVWHNKQAKTNNIKTTTQNKQVPAKDPYEGWKEYCSKTWKACFKYPSDWITEAAEPHLSNGEAVSIKGPKGLKLEWQAEISGIGGGCDADTDPHVYIHKVLQVTAVDNFYAVETGLKDNANHIGLVDGKDGKAPVTGDTGDCLYYTTFAPKNTIDSTAWLQGTWHNDTEKSDLTSAELILQSFHYQ